MNPINSSQGGDELVPTSPSTPQNPQQPAQPQGHQAAAANVIRSQIDSLYGDNVVATPQAAAPAPVQQPQQYAQQHQSTQAAQQAPAQQPVQQPTQATHTASPYDRTHTEHPQPEAEQWKTYHSAWQNYYQKYYEAYYDHQTKQNASTVAATSTQQADGLFSNAVHDAQPEHDEELGKDEALFELRQQLLTKVRGQAKKIRGSKHFIPIAAAMAVVLIFVFIQYNRVFIGAVNAYVSPGSMDPQNIVIDPSADATVSGDPKLIIPKINVDVPAIYGIGYDNDSQMKAMENGVAHFGIPGANSRPGEVGNTVLSGHSSNDLFDGGDYKFIFAQLEKLTVGDTIYANYEGKRYTYVVTKTEVVKPTEVTKLIYPTDKPMLTLITCTPLGTALNRLLVTAEQISPDPSAATAAPEGSGSDQEAEAAIPGSSPTLIERLFGAR